MSFTVEVISFEEILPVWKQKLWPQRASAIEPLSAIDHDGSINMEIMKSRPVFMGIRAPGSIEFVGVISGFKTSSERYRSRGLWVSEKERGNGLGLTLLSHLETIALKEGCTCLWTMARKTAWPFYEKMEFVKISEIDKYEFGPHILCEKKI